MTRSHLFVALAVTALARTSAALAGPPVVRPSTRPATAVEVYSAGPALIRSDGPSNSPYIGDTDHPPFPPQWHALAEKAWADNAPLRTAVRRATTLPAGTWPDWADDEAAAKRAGGGLNASRAVANELADAAL